MAVSSCNPSTFASLSIPGISIKSASAQLVRNYTASAPSFTSPNNGAIGPVQLDFCNVTVSHRHHGHDEAIITQIWLPTTTWNGRLQATGGGGFIAGLFGYMLIAMDAAIAEGYAAASTNAGIYATDPNGGDAHTWALPQPGKVDMYQLENFAYRSMGDLSAVSKAVLKLYYKKKPEYSYFSGGSNGGRQGYVLAQRYPDAFDGIAACAPGIYWDQMPEGYWKGQIMNNEKDYPWLCEFAALRNAMLQACDELDGVKDSVLQDPEACHFDPQSMLGKTIDCPEAGRSVNISDMAIKIARGEWQDDTPWKDIFRWLNGGYDSDLTVGTTACTNTSCTAATLPFPIEWLRTFVKKDQTWDITTMTDTEYIDLVQQSTQEYKSVIGITSYSLSAFAKSGGKMITYQGMSDPVVSFKNTRRFYDAVAKRDPSVHDYYRLFMAPGLGHVIGGRGAYPHTTFHALVDWVEKGRAPDTLEATSAPDETGNTINRVLCSYPKKSKYDGKGDPNRFSSWLCV